jgi:hypothetical protein
MRVHATLLFVLMTLAGCVVPSLSVSPGATSAASMLVPDCAFATLAPADATCVRFLEGGSGRQTEASLATHPTDPRTVLVSWTAARRGRRRRSRIPSTRRPRA